MAADEPTDRSGIIDIAQRTGFSKSTVSRALLGQPGVSDKTRDKIVTLAQELGYVKDQRGRDLKSRTRLAVGIYVRASGLSYYGELISLVQERLEAIDARTIVATATSGNPTGARAFAELLGQRPDAVIVSSGRIPDDMLISAARWTPTVVVGRGSPAEHKISSVSDDGVGADELALRVAEAGHRQVGVITVPERRSVTLHPRSHRMRRALHRLGIETHAIPVEPHQDVPSAVALAAAVDEVTAIMCPNDPILVATWEQLNRMGLDVPADMSLTGYDGIGQLATPILALTTWRQDVEAIAERTVQLVQQNVSDRTVGHERITGAYIRGRTLRECKEIGTTARETATPPADRGHG